MSTLEEGGWQACGHARCRANQPTVADGGRLARAVLVAEAGRVARLPATREPRFRDGLAWRRRGFLGGFRGQGLRRRLHGLGGQAAASRAAGGSRRRSRIGARAVVASAVTFPPAIDVGPGVGTLATHEADGGRLRRRLHWLGSRGRRRAPRLRGGIHARSGVPAGSRLRSRRGSRGRGRNNRRFNRLALILFRTWSGRVRIEW